MPTMQASKDEKKSTAPREGRIPKARAPRVGRPLGRFTQHRRIDKLQELLESEPRGLTLEDLARTLRITQRSVRRYLRELDGTTELESIEITPGGAHLWRIKPSERGRAVSLRRAQAYALLATRRAFEVLKGSALHDEIELAFAQIEQVAKTPFRASGKSEISGERALESRFFWLPPVARSYVARGEDLDEVFRAVADLRVLRFRPRTRAGEPRAERITFHPYGLVLHKGVIFALGVSATAAANRPPPASRRGRDVAEDDEVEVVAFDAMTEIRASENEHFVLPASFDASNYVQGEFGMGRPSRQRIIIEFDARVADEIRARKLHREQKLATSPDGRVRVQLPLVNVDTVVGWVLSYGDAAQVVEPPEIVSRIAGILDRARQRYR